MKKSELTQLTQIIEHLVAREVRKQLPNVIAEVFQQGLNKQPVLTEKQQPKPQPQAVKEAEEQNELQTSLKELFSGVTPSGMNENQQPVQKPQKQYTKNPILNQILNETSGDLRQRERMVGGAAAVAGYSTMPSPSELAAAASIPVSAPPVLAEGQESRHVPMAAMPEGVSVLDVAKAGMVPEGVSEALTNFDRMKKILEQSKGKRR